MKCEFQENELFESSLARQEDCKMVNHGRVFVVHPDIASSSRNSDESSQDFSNFDIALLSIKCIHLHLSYANDLQLFPGV